MRTIVLVLTILRSAHFSLGQTADVTAHKMTWWKDAKFGMFIHWGVYSVPAGKWGNTTTYGEWIMHSAKIPRATYTTLTKEFNPGKFNAESWVLLAKAAGQKYIVITSKHHDGFAMYKSDASAYNIVDATPFKRDVLRELADACRKYGMKLGFYYSQAQDWFHPGGAVSGNTEWDSTHKGEMNRYIDSIAIPQVKEILANYGDVAVLWWDTPANMTREMAKKLADLTKPYPNLITNNRLGAGMGGDLETPEQFIPATGFPGRNWEVCMTMNGHWGYNAFDERWKTTEELLRKLIDIVSKGGNFLLNVGPDQYGVIPEVCQQQLREIGSWMDLNGEAIYGTTASPFAYLPWGRATRKGQLIYLHVFDWPKNRTLLVPLSNKIRKAYLMEDKATLLKHTSISGSLSLALPAYAPDKKASVIVLEIDGDPNVLPVPSHGKEVKVISGSGVGVKELTDGDPRTKWQDEKGRTTSTLEIDLGKECFVQAMALVEPWHPWSAIIQKHELQYLDGANWKTVLAHETNGTGVTVGFNPVKGRKFRLLLSNEKAPPSVGEWMLYLEK